MLGTHVCSNKKYFTSFPGTEEGEEKAPGTYCLHMRLIAMKFCGDCVCMCAYVYTGDIINSLHWCTSWCSVWVSFILRCSVPSSSWVPQDKAQEKTGCLQWVCLPRKHAFMRLSTNFGKSIPTMAYQTFLFVPDSIKLGRACSSDVYSILRPKAELIFMMVYVINVDRHISTCHVPL